MEIPENFKIKRNLTALVEFSRIINASLDLDFILNNVLLTCMGKFLATRGVIALKTNYASPADARSNGKDNIHFRLMCTKGISVEHLENFPALDVSADILNDPSVIKFMKENRLPAAETIMSSEECVGFICLGEKLNQSPYSDDDLEFLRTILNISATAIQNSKVLGELTRVNRTLDSKVQKLNALFELSKEFGLINESTKVARLLVYSVIGQFLVSRFAVVVYNDDEPVILESKLNKTELLKALKDINISVLNNPVNREKIKESYNELDKLKIELVVPMQVQGKTKGLVLLGSRINGKDYSKDDTEFISSVGSLAIISLENQRLFLEALEKQKIEEELEIARDIQRNLLPHSIPQFRSFEVAASNISSRQVGGDYYDVIKLDEDNFCISIADVVGKGVPASLLMANIQAFLKVICKQGMNINEATGLINDLVTENITDGKFITFFWAVLNNKNLTLEYVNAGHNPPLLVREGKITKLVKGGMILGVLKTITPYESEVMQLRKDDVIILFTDGISEARNIYDEEFSDHKLEELAVGLSDKNADIILSLILKEVENFAVGTLQSDDLTLMVLKVK
jgi:phosphoserine phosphatase RsbU/P